MRCEQNDSILGKVVNIVPQAHALLRVEPCGRLIEDQHLRLAEHCLRKQNALLHAAGE